MIRGTMHAASLEIPLSLHSSINTVEYAIGWLGNVSLRCALKPASHI